MFAICFYSDNTVMRHLETVVFFHGPISKFDARRRWTANLTLGDDELFVDVEQGDATHVLGNYRCVRYRNNFLSGGPRYLRPFRRTRRHTGARLLPQRQWNRRWRALWWGWNVDRWNELGLVCSFFFMLWAAALITFNTNPYYRYIFVCYARSSRNKYKHITQTCTY